MIIKKIYGWLLEKIVQVFGKPIKFKDWNGNLFWQHQNDSIALNCIRSSVTDSINVIMYINNLKLSNGSVCIDIGAHYGGVSLALWKKVKPRNGYVVSIEPNKYNNKRLKENIILNGYQTDYVSDYAISNKSGSRTMKHYPSATGWSSLDDFGMANSKEFELLDIETCTFPKLLSMYEIDETKIDLVKIDTEGHELFVLESMIEFLKRKSIKRIVFEVNPLMLEGSSYSIDDLFNFWKILDYEIFRIYNDGSYSSFTSWPERTVGDCVAIAK